MKCLQNQHWRGPRALVDICVCSLVCVHIYACNTLCYRIQMCVGAHLYKRTVNNVVNVYLSIYLMNVVLICPLFLVFQLVVGSARSFATPRRSRERSQYLPHRCLSRPPKKTAPIFLPRRLCWFTWRLPSPPARSRCHCLESKWTTDMLCEKVSLCYANQTCKLKKWFSLFQVMGS